MPADLESTVDCPSFAGTTGKQAALQAMHTAINSGDAQEQLEVLCRISLTLWNSCTDKDVLYSVNDAFTSAVA